MRGDDTMKSRICSILLILFVIVSISLTLLSASELTKEEKDWLEKGYRYEKNGWIFVHIEGQPYERGFQHGYLLAEEIKEALRVSKFLVKWYTGEDFEFFVDASNRIFAHKIDEEFLTEIQGIADGAIKCNVEITYQELICYNGFFELVDYWWPEVKGKNPSKTDKCSAFIATGKFTKDGGIVMAHNSWDIYAHGDFFNIIMDIKPEKGYQILMQSSPGLIDSSTDYFVTDAGLIGTETTIGGYSGFDSTKTPEFLRERKAMQYAQNIDQWVGIMEQDNNGAYANSWLLGDLNTGEIARFEMGLK